MRTIIIGLAILAFGAVPALAAGSATAGKDVYDKACKTCHGPTGQANPGIVKMMKVEIKNLGSHDVQSLGDEDLKKIITNGKGKMQPIHSVTGKSVDDVIAYIRTLKKRNRTRNIGLRTRRSANAQNAPEAFSEEEKYAA